MRNSSPKKLAIDISRNRVSPRGVTGEKSLRNRRRGLFGSPASPARPRTVPAASGWRNVRPGQKIPVALVGDRVSPAALGLRPQVESNHHLSFRRALLYPLEL